MKRTSLIAVLTLTFQVCAFGQLTGTYQYLNSTTDTWDDPVDSAFVEFTDAGIFKYWDHGYLNKDKSLLLDKRVAVAKWWVKSDSLYVFSEELNEAVFDSIFWETAKREGFRGDTGILLSQMHWRSTFQFEVDSDGMLTLLHFDKPHNEVRIDKLKKLN
jgi:hypothetical protein